MLTMLILNRILQNFPAHLQHLTDKLQTLYIYVECDLIVIYCVVKHMCCPCINVSINWQLLLILLLNNVTLVNFNRNDIFPF